MQYSFRGSYHHTHPDLRVMVVVGSTRIGEMTRTVVGYFGRCGRARNDDIRRRAMAPYDDIIHHIGSLRIEPKEPPEPSHPPPSNAPSPRLRLADRPSFSFSTAVAPPSNHFFSDLISRARSLSRLASSVRASSSPRHRRRIAAIPPPSHRRRLPASHRRTATRRLPKPLVEAMAAVSGP